MVYVYLQDERYMVVMNDRQVMKLISAQEDLPSGMHPVLMREYAGYYTVNYKQLLLSSDEVWAGCIYLNNLDDNASL